MQTHLCSVPLLEMEYYIEKWTNQAFNIPERSAAVTVYLWVKWHEVAALLPAMFVLKSIKHNINGELTFLRMSSANVRNAFSIPTLAFALVSKKRIPCSLAIWGSAQEQWTFIVLTNIYGPIWGWLHKFLNEHLAKCFNRVSDKYSTNKLT